MLISGVLLFFCLQGVIAKQQSVNAEGIYLLTDNVLTLLHSSEPNLTESPTRAVPLPLRRSAYSQDEVANEFAILFAELDSSGYTLYTVEVRGQDANFLPTETRLVKTNLLNNEREVLTEQPGIFAFSVSPDQANIALAYYDGLYEFGRRKTCVLNVITHVCTSVDVQFGDSPALWLDSQHYVVTIPWQLAEVNITDFSIQVTPFPQEWSVFSSLLIPNTNVLVLAAENRNNHLSERPSYFLTFDLQSRELLQLPYRAAPSTYYIIDTWAFSSNATYLVYGPSYGVSNRMAVIEFETGRLIAEFHDVRNYQWLNDETLALQGPLNNTFPSIVLLNASTSEITSLATGSAAEGIMLVAPESSSE